MLTESNTEIKINTEHGALSFGDITVIHTTTQEHIQHTHTATRNLTTPTAGTQLQTTELYDRNQISQGPKKSQKVPKHDVAVLGQGCARAKGWAGVYKRCGAGAVIHERGNSICGKLMAITPLYMGQCVIAYAPVATCNVMASIHGVCGNLKAIARNLGQCGGEEILRREAEDSMRFTREEPWKLLFTDDTRVAPLPVQPLSR